MFRVKVFGGLSVERDGEPIEGLGGRRPALLAALAVAGRRGVSRDRLLLYLWPDSTEERGRHSLAQTVYSLHKTLGQEIVESAGHEVRLAEAVTSDVGDLLAAHARGDWEAVAAAYHGPLLDGFILSDAAEFDAWVGAERVRLEGIAREAFEALARQADESGDAAAVKHWRRLVDLDPLTTRYAVGYARALARAADTGSAVRHLREHSARLKAELSLPTPPDVAALLKELARHQPAPAPSDQPDRPTDVAPDVAPSCGEGPSATRPAAATPAGSERARSPRRLLLPVALGSVIAVAAFVWYARAPARSVAGGGMVVLADIDNLSGDSTLTRPLGVALRVGLEQAGNFSVYPRSRLRTSLARMGRAITDTVLGEALAREIAQRESGHAVIAVALTEVGGRFELTGRIVDPRTGQSLASHRVAVAGQSRLLEGIDRLAAWTRRELGDARWDTGAQLPLVTTSSVAALTAFAGATAAMERLEWNEARALLEHAIALDTGFALAQAILGEFHLFTNRIPDALSWLREADRRVARLTEPEQLQVKAMLARAEGNRDAAIGYAGALVAKYPSGPDWLFYGESLREARRYSEAVLAITRALAIDSSNLDAYQALALAHKGLGNYREALDAYAEIERRDSTYLLTIFRNQQWGETHVATGNLAAADSVFRRMLGRPRPDDRARGHRSLAYLAIRRGRFGQAVEELRAGIRLQAPGSLSEYRDLVVLADVTRTLGDDAASAAALDRAFAIFRRTGLQPAAVMFGGHQLVLARQLDRARLLLDSLRARARLRPASSQDQAALAILQADLALATGRLPDARGPLDRAGFDAYDALGLQLRAEMFERLNQLDSALVMARAATEQYTFGLETQTDWLRSFATLARIAEAAGDSAAARQAWSALIDLWREGDPDLPPLVEARRELARLQSGAAR